MNYCTKIGLLAAITGCFLVGCGKQASDGAAATTANTNAGSAAPAAVGEGVTPITVAASDFLDAVIKGDTQRSSARLTPKAIEKIISSGMQFQPPGSATMVYQIGDVRSPSADQAIVQCVVTDKPGPDKEETSNELCVLLRHVESDWRVSGIAYGQGPAQPWTLWDFETGQVANIGRQPMRGSSTPSTGPAASRPSPRVAELPSATTTQ